MIVAEYRSPRSAEFSCTAATFTGTSTFSTGLDLELNTPAAITIANRSTALTATIRNGLFFTSLRPCFSHQSILVYSIQQPWWDAFISSRAFASHMAQGAATISSLLL